MTEATITRLRVLRTQLDELDPFPWSNVEAWIASATPLMKRGYADLYDEFLKITQTPNWLHLPRWLSHGSRWTGEGPSDNFAEASAKEKQSNTRRAKEAKARILAFVDNVLELDPYVQPAEGSQGGQAIHAGRDVVFGARSEATFNHSTVGAAATAPGAVATNTQTTSVEQYKADVERAQQALVKEQTQLDEVHEALGDGLWQVLKLARKIQLDVNDLSKAQAQLKESVDDIWVKQQLGSVKVPARLEVAKTLLSSPVLAAGMKGILEIAGC